MDLHTLFEMQWSTMDGKIIKAEDMTIPHIRNAIKYTQRRLESDKTTEWKVKKHTLTIQWLEMLLEYKLDQEKKPEN